MFGSVSRQAGQPQPGSLDEVWQPDPEKPDSRESVTLQIDRV